MQAEEGGEPISVGASMQDLLRVRHLRPVKQVLADLEITAPQDLEYIYVEDLWNMRLTMMSQ